jgi:hypothetical protein
MPPDAVKRLGLASAACCLGPSRIHQSSNPRRSSRCHDRGKFGALQARRQPASDVGPWPQSYATRAAKIVCYQADSGRYAG